MANTRVMILEGSNGQSFFFKETLLAEGLADQVDLVSWADEAIEMIRQSIYDLVVINLVEAWEQGMQLSLWLSQHPSLCPTILVISSDLDRPLTSNGSFIILTEPLSLRDFATSVQAVLQPTTGNNSPGVQNSSSFRWPSLPGWSGQPLYQEEYQGYWSPYSYSF
jgi:DNA-binding NtrC family response regulator